MPGKKKKKSTKKKGPTDEEKEALEEQRAANEELKEELPVYGWLRVTVSQEKFKITAFCM